MAMPTWSEQLRALRQRRGLASVELASRAGISFESIKSYEAGRRRPKREQLARVLACLAADGQSRNLIFTAAGFAPDLPIGRFAEPNMSETQAVRLVNGRPCPAFLLNYRAEVVAVNPPGRKLFGLPSARPSRRRPETLTIAARHAIAERCENWETVVAQTIRIFKSGEPAEGALSAPSPAFAPVLEAIAAGHPARMKRLSELWESTPPWQDRWTGQAYPVIWMTGPRSRIRFDCLMSCLNTELGLFMHNYMPADAKSYQALEKLLAG
jgi:transcriptional regulator with XRE-family HTH domain